MILKFGSFIGRLPSDGTASMAVKGLNMSLETVRNPTVIDRFLRRFQLALSTLIDDL